MSETKKVTMREAFGMVFKDRQVLAMLLLGLASGLPYVAVGGTLNAWMSTEGVKTSTIGLLSWAALAYVFKFMWAAALQKRRTPFNLSIGPRRFWLFVFIIPITIGLFLLASSNPPNGLGQIGLISVFIAVFSASFDIVLAAWRIESARDDAHLDILSTVEQLGYRTASLLGGFVALLLADHFGWKNTFYGGAMLMALCSIGIMLARPVAQQKEKAGAKPEVMFGKNLSPRLRNIATLVVLAGWTASLFMLVRFMYGALTTPADYSAREFMRTQSPWVVFLTVILLGCVAAYLVWLDRAKAEDGPAPTTARDGVLGIFYGAILEPMMELVSRHGAAVILIIGLVMTYRFTDLIWGSFAYPFYLGQNFGALGHTLTEVGLASKLIGVFATMFGILMGGLAMLKFGRMPVFFVGAVLAAVTNLLFADLANGAVFMDKMLGATRLDDLVGAAGLDIRMARLIVAIALENIAIGIASAASIAYLSSVVNKEYAAVQYALLVSLTFLFGILGRPLIGDIVEEKGFAYTFILCAWLGGVAVILAGLEWARQSRLKNKNSS